MHNAPRTVDNPDGLTEAEYRFPDESDETGGVPYRPLTSVELAAFDNIAAEVANMAHPDFARDAVDADEEVPV